MTWQTQFRPQDEGVAYILRPEPVLYSSRSQAPKKRGFIYFFGVYKMKFRNIAKKFGAVLAVTGAGVGSASAAVAESVTTALSDAQTDVGTIGAAGLLIVIGIAVYRYMKRSA